MPLFARPHRRSLAFFFLAARPIIRGICVAPLTRQSVAITLLSCAVWLICTRWVLGSYHVEGRCMEPNLVTGERVLGEKISLRLRAPRRGDVVIFFSPDEPGALYVKRVVAASGETVSVRGGTVFVNGRALREPYRVRPAHGDFAPHVVRPGFFFLLGDNRDDSSDSREFGDVPAASLVARAAVRFWPPGRGLHRL